MFDVSFNGKYHLFPLQGVVADGFYFKDGLQLSLDTAHTSHFDLRGPFEFMRDGQHEQVHHLSQRCVEVAHSLLGKPLRQVRANAYGVLEMDFGEAGQLMVPDGAPGCWEFTHIHYGTPMQSIRLVGGGGSTVVSRH